MVSILLTGIPRIGKTELARYTQKLSRGIYGKTVSSISLGDLVFEEANRLWGTPRNRRHFIDFSYQQPLRSYAISEAALRIMYSNAEHIIVDTPMTVFLHGENPNIIFDVEQLYKLDQAAGGFDYIVTLIDDAEEVAKRLEDLHYPTDPVHILNWMAVEVDASDLLVQENKDSKASRRKLVIPRNHSAETLIKLLYDCDNPPVTYLGFPISHLKDSPDDSFQDREQKRADRERIQRVIEEWKRYSVAIVPIQMSDERAGEERDRAATRHRDKHWFIRHSDYMLAFFPEDVLSFGVVDEMSHTSKVGKDVILIHPQRQFTGEVFGVRPMIYAANEDEFFQILEKGPPAGMERFFKSGEPRYAELYENIKELDSGRVRARVSRERLTTPKKN